ncbi:putative cell wall integrity and stress response component [Phaeomoniella chlamydospora]|uniref:Putative cell wall integrity and stress response component n=1 Tax=Phaeomoniella chlamydospora TaxID=158046 RepID=A0A0G2DZP7_PHACM|nr:putative cell wall integrity and stress response component [Phaeomoniella chlamydospora]
MATQKQAPINQMEIVGTSVQDMHSRLRRANNVGARTMHQQKPSLSPSATKNAPAIHTNIAEVRAVFTAMLSFVYVDDGGGSELAGGYDAYDYGYINCRIYDKFYDLYDSFHYKFSCCTDVSTIIVTPSSSATSDSSPLGQGASNDSSSNGLSKGAVAGIAVGVALGVTMIAVIILLFLWRRMKKRRAEAEAGTGPEAVGGAGGSPNSVSRHTSQMSQSGLLSKAPRLNTRIASNGLQSSGQSGSTISPTGTTNRRSIGADQRLDAYHPIYTHENLQHSDVSLQDNMDYSRKILAVRNPGPEDE